MPTQTFAVKRPKNNLTIFGHFVQLSNMMAKRQISWELIDLLAEGLGVSYWARRKWRERENVPYKWRLPLIMASKGALSAKDFDLMDRRRARRDDL